MSQTLRRKVDVEHLGYRPTNLYPYDLEVFHVSELKQRTREEAMSWTYSYEFYMLICVTQGQCVQFVDFEPVSCSAGTLLTLRPGQAHNFGSNKDWDGCIILFRPEFLLPAGAEAGDPQPLFDLERLPNRLTLDTGQLVRAVDAIRRMREDSLIETSSRSSVSPASTAAQPRELIADVQVLLRYQLYAFAAWLAVVHGQRRIQEPQHFRALQRFNRFQKVVDQRFAEWKQLNDYAKHLGCTEKSLARATALAVGMSAKVFISKRVNLEAKRLLAHSDLPVGVIAEKLGFREATHFSKFFKRETSRTPKEFRAHSAHFVPVPAI
jgi:AraC-like DNA-binding protein